MNLQVVDKPIQFTLHGFSGKAIDKDYAGTAFQLMDRMWKIVKSENLKTKGLNVWVYEPNEMVFAGVELESTSDQPGALEQKKITILEVRI